MISQMLFHVILVCLGPTLQVNVCVSLKVFNRPVSFFKFDVCLFVLKYWLLIST